MIRVGEYLDAARRRRVVDLATAVIGGGDRGAQLALERVWVLAPGDLVTAELANYVGRLIAIAVGRCAVCLEPGRGLHAACAAQHKADIKRALAPEAAPVDRTIRPIAPISGGGRRR